MSVLLVASDRPGAGKTAVAVGLARVARRAGIGAAAFKPFASSADDRDARVIGELANRAPDGWPMSIGDSGPTADDLRSTAGALEDAGAELSIVELPSAAGPEGARAAADALGASALLVAGYRRGLTGDDLKGWRDRLGDRLIGALVNGVTRYMGTEARNVLAPSVEGAGVKCLGLIPEDRLMLSVSIEEARAGLGGRYVVDEGDTNGPIEWFQVGGMSLDPGELRFGLYENNAVVVRGDRPDIQMSALNASASCLVLTGGIEPIEYILYEAREEETPIMVVEPDTLATMAALEGVSAGARMDGEVKARRFSELLEAHVDMDALLPPK